MSNLSKLVVAIAACGGLLMSLRTLTPHASSVVAATLTGSHSLSSAGTEDARPAVAPVIGIESNTTDVFGSMRAALAIAKSRARQLTSYTATLEMQEEVRGKLREMDTIQVKLRQEPFSVYMRWSDNGQEALFVSGKNEDRLLAKPVNGLAALKRLWRLDPDSRMAKQGCRYSITQSGIENLVNRVHEFYAARDDWSSAVSCSVSKSSETGNVVTEYCLQFRDKNVSPDYVESRLSFNEATGLLIVVQNFGWTDDKLPRIVEHYAYRSIDQTATLNDNDFDETNSAYEFVAR